jgi:hypothetical protein
MLVVRGYSCVPTDDAPYVIFTYRTMAQCNYRAEKGDGERMTFEAFKSNYNHPHALELDNDDWSMMRDAWDAATKAERERIAVFLETHSATIDSVRGYVLQMSRMPEGMHHNGMTYADAIRRGDA